MENVTVNAAIEQVTENKLSLIKKYPLEFLIILLFASVGYLFFLQNQQSAEFKNHLLTTNKAMIEVLRDNTETLKFYRLYSK